jgi:hypothetical protein
MYDLMGIYSWLLLCEGVEQTSDPEQYHDLPKIQ